MIVKFCGFKYSTDVDRIRNLNVDAIGFIHFTKSKRHVTIKKMQQLTKLIPSHIDRVAVVVDPSITLVETLIKQTNINTIQLHGNERVQLIKNIKAIKPGIKITKAIPADKYLKEHIQKYQNYVDLFIIDTPSENYGGTGKVFNWNMLKNIKNVKFLIAGGLNIENIQQLEKLQLGQAGYDIASGIETNNFKDFNKWLKS
ncbi:phosphoribosylanthranilate isomerase [Staphylococcus saccharolyticus]|nr:phosphoribosylanthranilate isomerase [Staphylococcus saccharolyticus]MBL7573155.1 phosphoribosylanthranilate isomerase [Staphylococcus saccharolyticus]MBL7583911.1 phosphoribosylanthranilate isomerase [Staphylococcus saccharolyticus]MBL7638771.1 phosphoribosylanthranilate isomerase [Staphylococcus saccharolyticus]QRJ67744.1 phosphoribosylanthranilate isomerase [Staphylococcus saccharolyticus]